MKNIAIVGAGLVGKRHIDVLGQSQTAQLSAIVDPNSEAEAVAAHWQVPWFQSLEAMLLSHQPDGAILASPNQMHVEQGLACVEAKLPMLVEKPIASDVQSAMRLFEAAEQESVPVLVGHHRRHNAIVRATKQKLEEGTIGKIVAVNGMCWLYKPDDYFDASWRKTKGAGPVFINLIHDVDLLRHFCGEVVNVSAVQSSDTRSFEVEDTAAIILQFEGGALATISVSDTIVGPWSWELTASENPAYPETSEACYLIGGTHGSLEVPNGRRWFNDGDRGWWQPIECEQNQVESHDPLDAQIDHFCAVIDGREEPLVSALEGTKTLQIIEAVKRAAETGQVIKIEPLVSTGDA